MIAARILLGISATGVMGAACLTAIHMQDDRNNPATQDAPLNLSLPPLPGCKSEELEKKQIELAKLQAEIEVKKASLAALQSQIDTHANNPQAERDAEKAAITDINLKMEEARNLLDSLKKLNAKADLTDLVKNLPEAASESVKPTPPPGKSSPAKKEPRENPDIYHRPTVQGG